MSVGAAGPAPEPPEHALPLPEEPAAAERKSPSAAQQVPRKTLRERFAEAAHFIATSYATADPRSLGLFRVALGTLLFYDVARRAPDLTAHYSNAGWLTNHFALFRPMSDHLFSIYLAFSTPEEVRVIFAFHLLVNLALIIGFYTRVAHVLAAILITSINSRNILLENGGWVVLNLLTVWTMFLPLGRRFSIDALVRSFKARKETSAEALNDRTEPALERTPVVSLAVTALILQWAVIYYFNVVHKNGPQWKDGTAVYYFFQQDRMVTELGAWLRDRLTPTEIWLMTKGTLVMESTVCMLMLVPFATHMTRMVAWALVCALHLPIDAVVQLGPFSWAMAVMFFALIPSQAWDRLGTRAVEQWPRRRLLYDPEDGASIAFARLIKRFDPNALVTFVPIPGDPPADADEAARARLKSQRRLVERTLVVTDAGGEQTFQGSLALRRLFDALPLFPILFFWIRWPGVRALVDRALGRAARRRAALSEFLNLSDLPRSPDRSAPPPPPARQFAGRVAFGFGQIGVLLLIIACGSQVLVENHAVPNALKPTRRPEWMVSLVVYPRLFQGWSMFAPGPPMDDGKVVVEGRTADGRHFDPLTGTAPDYDVQPKGGFHMNQIWGDFHRRIAEPRFSAYLGGVQDFLLHHHEITGRPADRLVAFEVWFVNQTVPPPGGEWAPPTRRKILSYGKLD